MTPLYPSSSSSVEKEEDDQILKLYIFSSTSQASSSQLPYATQHDQRGIHLQGSLQLPHDHKAEKSMVSAGGSSDDCQVISSTFLLKSTVSCGNNEPREALDSSRDDHQELEDHSKPDDGSAKNWMSSKMRLMQKMMINTNKKPAANSDHKPASRICTQNLGSHRYGRWETRSCSSYNNGVRVCSDCNTTTTPLWRSGPQGPKSLCNACGIRQRKARRAMAEAANGGSVVLTMDAPSGKQNKEKKSRTSYHDGHDDIVTGNEKNKCSKITDNSNSDSQSEGNISFDNFTVSLSKTSSAFRRVFPRDEEEAAILLMELSCGLVHSC